VSAAPGTRRAFLGLGSNLGDRHRYLADAVGVLVAGGNASVSLLFESDPVGGPGGQGPYLNVVVELDTDRTARQLLELGQRLESAAGRARQEQWGPRTLDVDLLWIDGVTVDEPDLVVPHPRMWERRFVLAPLRELAPDLVSEAQLVEAGGDVRCLRPWGPPRA
jgi:2-amino-4-hydroxy-6-hydroxymethyldihydropteridine diphosphokinase